MVDGEAMTTLQERLQEGVGINIQGQGADAKVVEKGGQVARLSLARAKPKMALESLDPMHFRNILNNLQLEFGSLSCFVELLEVTTATSIPSWSAP